MKAARWLLGALLIGSAFAASSGQEPAELRLFDFLDKPAYRASWNALFRGEKNVDPWLARYAKTRNGPSSPGEIVELGGVPYQTANVCKAHDCGDNQFHVLFAPKGARAWGLLLTDLKKERFFGKPDEEKKDALREAAQK